MALSPITAFDITQLEPIFTFFIRVFFFNVEFNPIFNPFPIFTEMSINVLIFLDFLYLTFCLNLKLSLICFRIKNFRN